MIRTKWGNEVEILEDCGLHQPKKFTTPAQLLKCRQREGSLTKFYFQEFLKADDGEDEILSAIEDAPSTVLTGYKLGRAIKQALYQQIKWGILARES